MPPIHRHTANRSGLRSLLACLVFGAGVYILVLIAAYHTQSAIIFRPGGLTVNPPTGFPIETVSIPTADGLRLKGWWLPASGTRRTVLFFQGNHRQQFTSHPNRLTSPNISTARLP